MILPDAGDNGINYGDNMSPCDVCKFAECKQHRHLKTSTRTTNRPLQPVYTDLLRHVFPPSVEGVCYVSQLMEVHSK